MAALFSKVCYLKEDDVIIIIQCFNGKRQEQDKGVKGTKERQRMAEG
jgi:hypothetical protein